MKKIPFTVILPVHNGGSHVKLCVESILSQAFGEFDLAVLENCSTDGTHEWLLTLCDSRIKIWSTTSLLSIEENWRRITEIPKNEFMTVIGHDDLLDPNYLEVMNQLIQENPDAGLYQAHFRLIDVDGKFIRSCLPMPERESAAEFLAARMTDIRDSFGTGYMMRSKDYDKLGGIPSYPKLLYADDALWLMLMESSWKVTAREECFSYRCHINSTSANPEPSIVFAALEQYVTFLDKLAFKYKPIADVVRRYGPRYILKWCQYYYHFLLNRASAENKLLSIDELQGINALLVKFWSGYTLEIMKEDPNIKLLEVSNKIPVMRKYIYHLSQKRHNLIARQLFKIISLILK